MPECAAEIKATTRAEATESKPSDSADAPTETEQISRISFKEKSKTDNSFAKPKPQEDDSETDKSSSTDSAESCDTENDEDDENTALVKKSGLYFFTLDYR